MRFTFYYTFVLLITIFTSHFSTGQTSVTIGTGTTANTTGNYPAPYGNYYWGSKHQFLIKATELGAAGASAGYIQSLAFNVASPSGVSHQSFTISLKHTSSASLSVFESGATPVWFGTYTESSGWNTHTFAVPFYWNGISNLLVETCFNNTSYSQNARTYYSNTSYTSTICNYIDDSNACSSSSTDTYTRRPNMRMVFAPAELPPTPGFTANATNTCLGDITFTDLSSPTPDSWKWYFGDGDSSSVKNPTHTYTSDGTYSVTLVVSNQYGDSSLTKTDYITVNVSGGVPKPAQCTPTTQNGTFGFGISNFSFNTINNNSANSSVGYEDFTCNQTNVYAGAEYTISAITNTPSPHNVRVWIDYNNDSILNNNTELVYSADKVLTTSGSIKIPNNPTLNAPLRLRISADYELSAIPTPCSNLQYGQAEDYTIRILPNPNKPEASFSADKTVTCNGTIVFTDESSNIPTQWLWDFGDGSLSVQKNPTHTFTSSGSYTVTLITSNSNGSDTIIMADYITVNLENDIIAPTCTPSTLDYCCSYGITNFSFNTINKASSDASAGYEDFSCELVTTVKEGNTYPVSIKTGSNSQDIKIWIDYNNDGTLSSNEIALQKLNSVNPVGSIVIPTGKTLNKTLRIRVVADFSGSEPESCTNLMNGQAEDYGIIIQPNIAYPVADFSVEPELSCDGAIQFNDASINSPSTWLWNFGDGQTSTLQNPLHIYTAEGTYSVKLTVSNTYGTDSITHANIVTVDYSIYCDTAKMPFSGFGPTLTSCTGLLMDNGGTFNYYSNSDGQITIAPTGASSIAIKFNEFELEELSDYLYIFDGPTNSSPIIGYYTGYELLDNTITSTSGSLTLWFTSDGFGTKPGFEAEWSCVTGISDFEPRANSIEVYPNPARETLTIDLKNFQKKNPVIELYDMLGQRVFYKNTFTSRQNLMIDISSLSSGVYMLNVTSDSSSLSQKIIIE